MQGIVLCGYMTGFLHLLVVRHSREQVADLVVELGLGVEQPLRQLLGTPEHDEESEAVPSGYPNPNNKINCD